jgi:hypothetical protein
LQIDERDDDPGPNLVGVRVPEPFRQLLDVAAQLG